MLFIKRLPRYFATLLGSVLIMLGGVVLLFEGLVVFAGDGRAIQPLGQVWYQHDPFVNTLGTASLPLFGAIIERKVHPLLWNPLITTLLGWPSWLALLFCTGLILTLGCGLIWIGRQKAKISP